MNIETARQFFLWCAVIHFGILFLWFAMFALAHDWMYRFHGKWFRLSVEQFDGIHYATMSLYKLGVILFALVPFVVLCIVG